MNHEEMVKEADRISKRKHEAWNYIFELLRRKEREKLNHVKVYECQETFSWYISNFEDNRESAEYPFGFFFADYLNQLLSLKSRETFISYERRMHSGAKAKNKTNPLFDKRGRYCIWFFNEKFSEQFHMDSRTTDKEFEDIYNSVCWLWEYVKDDVATLVSDLIYLKNNPVSNDIIYKIYGYVQRMVLLIWHRQINSSCYDKNSEDYNSDNEYLRITDESIAEHEANNQEIISPDFVMNNFVAGFRYTGYEAVKFTDGTDYFCRTYDVANLLHLVAEDMLRFMLHQTTHKFEFCPECKCMYVTTHGNQKHCPACRLIIRQKKRKENKARYLHKNILDYINNYRSEDLENGSESFRNESNYYWDIVQGKNPEKVKAYSAKIKTEADYMAWLEKKYKEIKSQK